MEELVKKSFIDLAIHQKMYSNKTKLQFRLDYIFKNVEVKDKSVLDVGGGSGLLSFYAAVKGARKVVCLEPEFDGSHAGMIEQFNKIKSALTTNLAVEHLPLTLQSYVGQVNDNEHDVVILHNSINHLDEHACINLLKDAQSYTTYKNIFTAVYNKMAAGGKLVVADCSCDNVFYTLGIKNYLYPTIEWHKHQKPGTWIALLKEIGFKHPKVEWTTPNKLGKAGRVLMGNPVVSYLTGSHFKFSMEK
jgi:cyclopropane fatty-acyl-phospholipid synthase-like methyltransferase